MTPKTTRFSFMPSLWMNFSWSLVGYSVYAASQWGLLIILAKLGTPEMVGEFSLGLAITAPIIIFCGLSLRYVIATDANQDFSFHHYFATRLATTFVALLAIAVVVLLGDYSTTTKLVALVIGLAKSVEAISDILHGLFQQNELFDRIAQSMILKGLLSLATMGLIIYSSANLLIAVTGLALAWTVVLFVYDVPNARRLLYGPESSSLLQSALSVLKTRQVKEVLIISFPLGLTAMLVSLSSTIPRYIIESELGISALGIFSSLAYLTKIGDTVAGAIGQAALPRLARYYGNVDILGFLKLLLGLLSLALVMAITSILIVNSFGRQLITLLYKPEYAENQTLLVSLMIMGGLSYAASFVGFGMTAARYFAAQLPLLLAVVVTVIIASIWLVPLHGLVGAVAAICISLLVQILGGSAIVLAAIRAAAHSTVPVEHKT